MRLPQVEKLLARLSDRVSELTEITAQGDNSALCAQLLVRRPPQPPSWHYVLAARTVFAAKHSWLVSLHCALQRMHMRWHSFRMPGSNMGTWLAACMPVVILGALHGWCVLAFSLLFRHLCRSLRISRQL